MKSTKKRPASKGHRRVALLEEEQGKPYLSNRKPGTSKGPTKRNLTPRPTVLCGAKHRSENRLANSVRQVLFQRGAAAPMANSGSSVIVKRSDRAESAAKKSLNFGQFLFRCFLASKLRVGVLRPHRPGLLITAESRQLLQQ